MKVLRWTRVVQLSTLACLSWSCGNASSLGSSGQSEGWSFDGMGGRAQAARGGSTTASGAAGSSASGGIVGASGALGAGGTSKVNASGGSTATGTNLATGGVSAPGGSPSTPTTGGQGANSGSSGAANTSGNASIGGTASGSTGKGGATSTGGSPGGVSTLYHQLADWAGAEANNPNHHGRVYFLGHAHKDENGLECTSCHGANYEGDSGPACTSCHQEWRSSCSYCHGTDATKSSPPRGIYDETSTGTLAVGRHAAHLSGGNSHVAFACTTCHTVPPANDVDHTLSYQPSSDLTTPGHHGDVTFTGIPPGMTWNVGTTTGTPVSARGTCVGSCHSDGHGGPPAKMPYWAGGSWTNSCKNCHADPPRTGHHSHALDEGGTCTNCHSGSTTTTYTATTHMNGKIDYLGTVAGQGMTLKADSACASGVRCNGLCHGESEEHNNECW